MKNRINREIVIFRLLFLNNSFEIGEIGIFFNLSASLRDSSAKLMRKTTALKLRLHDQIGETGLASTLRYICNPEYLNQMSPSLIATVLILFRIKQFESHLVLRVKLYFSNFSIPFLRYVKADFLVFQISTKCFSNIPLNKRYDCK